MKLLQFINSQEPVASWSGEKKQKFLDRFCTARRYDPESGMSKVHFFNRDILNYVKTMVDSRARVEAIAELVYEKTELDA